MIVKRPSWKTELKSDDKKELLLSTRLFIDSLKLESELRSNVL